MNVVVFAPHNDDHALAMGGTIAKHYKQGDTVHTFIASFGEKSHPHYKPEVIRKTRVKEAQRADRIYGGKGNIVFLGLRELKFREDFERKGLKRKLAKRLKALKPKAVYYPAPNDQHPDHKAFARCIIELLDEATLKATRYAYYVYPVLSRLDAPRIVVDVSDTHRKKLEALSVFTSQFNPFSYVITNNATYVYHLLRNGFTGVIRGMRWAETFYKE